MGNIIVLDEKTANQIAAGEVVEGPSSVVKEMVENAVDAGATQVQVEIRSGGVKLIRVSDNGSGMEQDDVTLAFERHATSKIRQIDDLDNIESMGFRGEALASIASVSRLEMQTKTADAANGTKVVVEGSQLISVEPVGCPVGTTFMVRDLFYNTPARYKFLKKDTTETARVADVLERLALAHPNVSFQLSANGVQILRTPGNGDLTSTIYSLYGKETAAALLPLSYTYEGITVNGFVGKPVIARGNRARQTFLMNRRYIQSRSMTAALDEAYKTLLMTRQFAFAVIVLNVPPFRVDVNVHPSKLEVRFSEEQVVFSAVYGGVKNALMQGAIISGFAPVQSLTKPERGTAEVMPAYMLDTMSQKPISSASGAAAGEDATLVELHNTGNHKQKVSDAADNMTLNSDAYINQVQRNAAKDTAEFSAVQDAPFIKGTQEHDAGNVDKQAAVKDAPETGTSACQQNQGEAPGLQSLPTEGAQQEGFIPIRNQNVFERTEKTTDSNKGDAPVDGNDTVAFHPQYHAPQTIFGEGEEVVFEAVKHPTLLQMTIVGQVFRTYIVLQAMDEMILLDQHAAHERIRFDALKESLATGKAASQQLMAPIPLNLSALEFEIAESSYEDLNRIGFEVEPFGRNTVLVRAIPTAFEGELSEVDLISVVCETPGHEQRNAGGMSDERLHSISCKGAVKAHQDMGNLEIQALLEQLSRLGNPYTCVHGRPVFIRFPKTEIEKRFKRIV